MKKFFLFLAMLPMLLLATPNAPHNLVFENVTSTSVLLRWQDNSHSETGYKIFRDKLPIAIVGKNVTSFQDMGLDAHHTYEYTVKATDDQPTWLAINSTKDSFGTNSEPLKFHLSNLAGGDKDWLGIFPIGATLNRANLLGWTYTHGLQSGDIVIDSIFSNQGHLSPGQYQVVVFYNNSYHQEAVSYFNITDSLTTNTSKDIYRTGEHEIIVNITNVPTKENNSDWLGIFQAGAANENNAVYTWKYTNNTQEINGNGQPYGMVSLTANLPAGDYEVRFFENASYTQIAKSSFKVSDEKVPADSYGQRGDKVVIRVETDDNDLYKVYYPENSQNAPVVLFLAGYSSKVSTYTALMDFIASQGYYVIGLNYSYYSKQHLVDRLVAAAADNNRADTSRVSIVGHSLGGAYAFNYLKHIKENNYALANNSIIELDGWFAFGMTPLEMRNLNTTSLIIQYGGADAIPKYQDPKINLGTYYMLEGDEKALLTIDANNNHSYQNGNINNADFSAAAFIAKQELLRPVHAFLDYTLKGAMRAKDIALQDNYQAVEQYIANPNEINLPYQYPCSIDTNKVPDDILDYDYCDLHSIISNRETWNR